MKSQIRWIRSFAALFIASGWLIGLSLWFEWGKGHEAIPIPAPPGRISDTDVWNAAVVATYEANVFPEPMRSDAYAAIIWTIRNRVEIGFKEMVSYSDERVLNSYSSYPEHRDDPPDPRALEIARQVLNAPNRDDDPTRGARHYVDHSYWTATSDQIGDAWKYRGKFSDTDVQRLVDDGKFSLTIEWKSSPDRVGTPVVYGLYFFDDWPPPMPVVTPLPTFTRRPTATRTRTATLTATPRFTPSPPATPSAQPYPRP